MSRGVSSGRRTCLELERIILNRHRSGSLGREDALNLFDELLPQARPASVHAFNSVLTVVARADSSSSPRHSAALAVSLFNTMARSGVNMMAAIIGIIIRCFCTVGRLDLAFAAFALFLKTGWRVQNVTLNQLIKGLCDGNRTDDAMDMVFRRMPELGYTPDVFSYNALIKGLCVEKKSQEALELLLHMTANGGYNCSPNVVSYNSHRWFL